MKLTRARATAAAMATAMAVGVTAVLVATATPAAAAADYQIGTFNMAGGNDEHGDKGDEAPDALVTSVQRRKPAFVTLQEACKDWVERLDRRLPGYTVFFDPVRSGNGELANCKHPSLFGNAILYRDDLGFAPDGVHDLDSPDGLEQREMPCIKSAARKLYVCSTHLSVANSDAREHETVKIADVVLFAEAAGYTVFVGGDFNDTPRSDTMDRLYHRDYGDGATGRLKEVDSPCGNRMGARLPLGLSCRSGEKTHDDLGPIEESWRGDKIDYLFVSPSVRLRWADATTGTHSDHDPLWAGVRF